MSDTPTPRTGSAASATPPTDPAPPMPPPRSGIPRAGRAHTILGRLSKAVREQNWFAVALEVCIVIVGVVIGFQVTAWGQAQSNAAKEQEYLRQLAADLRETEQMVADADSFMVNGPHPAASRLLQTWGAADRPPRDSVLVWVRSVNRTYSLRPVLGTAEALVATGDLTLLRDEALRAEITLYLDLTRDHLAKVASIEGWSREALVEIGRRFDYLDAVRLAPGRDRRERGEIIAGLNPVGDWASPFPLDVEAFYADQEVYNWVYVAALAHANYGVRRRSIREDAEALRQRVEAQIEP